MYSNTDLKLNIFDLIKINYFLLNLRFYKEGFFIEKFEKKFKKYCNAKYVVMVSSGTSALIAILASLNLKKGEEVIMPVYGFVSVANVILSFGAIPVFIDINQDSMCINTDKILDKITKKTRAIIVVDLFGRVCNLNKLKNISKQYKIPIIEDACHSLGNVYFGKKIGSISDFTYFSFNSNKNIFSFKGGIITLKDKKNYKKIRYYVNYGFNNYGKVEQFGLNYRPSDVQALVALTQLEKINFLIKKRVDVASFYTELLQNDKLILPPLKENGSFVVYNRFIFKLKDNALIKINKRVFEKRFEVPFIKPLHLYKHLKHLGYNKGDFPVAENVIDRIYSLPFFANIRKKNIIENCNFLLKKINIQNF